MSTLGTLAHGNVSRSFSARCGSASTATTFPDGPTHRANGPRVGADMGASVQYRITLSNHATIKRSDYCFKKPAAFIVQEFIIQRVAHGEIPGVHEVFQATLDRSP